LVFHTHIYSTLIRLTPSITYSFSISLFPHHSTTFNGFRYTIFIHRCSICLFVTLGFVLLRTGALPHKPHLHFLSLWLLWRWGVLQTICSGWPQTTILPISASQIAGITSMNHECPATDAMYFDIIHFLFLSCPPQTL
jgi:hypothetical protein